MSYRHFVQVGRVAWLNYGRNEGQLCTIIDVIDQNRALVEGPRTSRVKRQAIPFKQLRLTKFRMKVPLHASTKVVRKIWEKDEIEKKWQETSTFKKMQMKKLRKNMNDFDRFKLFKAKQAYNREVKTAFFKLRAHAKKAPPKPKKAKKAAPKKGAPKKK